MADTNLMQIPGHIDPVPVPRDITPRADGRVDILALMLKAADRALDFYLPGDFAWRLLFDTADPDAPTR